MFRRVLTGTDTLRNCITNTPRTGVVPVWGSRSRWTEVPGSVPAPSLARPGSSRRRVSSGRTGRGFCLGPDTTQKSGNRVSGTRPRGSPHPWRTRGKRWGRVPWYLPGVTSESLQSFTDPDLGSRWVGWVGTWAPGPSDSGGGRGRGHCSLGGRHVLLEVQREPPPGVAPLQLGVSPEVPEVLPLQ